MDITGIETTTFVRRPFTVQAFEVTEDNLDKVAELINGKTGRKEDGTPFVNVPRGTIWNVPRIYVGFMITILDDKIHAYSPNSFPKQFAEYTSANSEWVEYMQYEEASSSAEELPQPEDVLPDGQPVGSGE